MPKAGRNDPCPCGSGKKYKKCCLDKVVELRSAEQRTAELHKLDEILINGVIEYAVERFGPRCDPASQFALISEHRPPVSLFATWTAYHYRLDERRLVDYLLDEPDFKLTERHRAWLKAQRQSWFGLWEVQSSESGHHIDLKDLLSGEERRVLERLGSEDRTPHEVLLCKVIDIDGLSVMAGCHDVPLDPDSASQVLERLCEDAGDLEPPIAPAQLRDRDLEGLLIGYWEGQIAVMTERGRPSIQTVDGQEVVFTHDHFELRGERDEVARRLRKIEGAQQHEREQDGELHFVFADGEVADLGEDPERMLGSAQLSEQRLCVDTLSVERADELRDAIEVACGELIKHRLREHEDLDAVLDGFDDDLDDDFDDDLDDEDDSAVSSEEAQAIARHFKQKHYADWVDHPLPALDGLSPRQAAAKKAMRRRLETLLKDLEYSEARRPEAERFDFSAIREELGL